MSAVDAPQGAGGTGALRAALDKDGYVVVTPGIERELIAAVADDIWTHVGADPSDPGSWYRPDVIKASTGMVEMYHYQSMWNIRQHPALRAVFAEIHRTPDLWVSIDRAAFKPPVAEGHPEFDSPGFIHWDTDINLYPNIALRVQGVLALVDCDADMGGFQCVPEVYRDLDGFLSSYVDGPPVPRTPDISGHEITKVPLRAGEMAIWKTTQLHGNGRNTSERVRIAQYVTMNPPPEDQQERARLLERRVSSWSRNEPAPGDGSFLGDARRIEQSRTNPAQLSALGRTLLGDRS